MQAVPRFPHDPNPFDPARERERLEKYSRSYRESQAKPLRAWWVGDYDMFAAEDAAQALATANTDLGPLTPWTADDVVEVSAEALDEQHPGEGGPWTLRQLLAETTEPGYLAGYEQ